MSIGEAVEEQVEAKAAVPWLQHTTYDYDNQQATPLFPGAPNELSGDKLTNGIGANDHQSMEVDDEDDIGFSLDQLLNIPKTSDIGQVNLCVFELMCNFSASHRNGRRNIIRGANLSCKSSSLIIVFFCCCFVNTTGKVNVS